MPVHYQQLFSSLLSNVVEVRFLRRRQFPNLPPIRRMLCTNNRALLTSNNGRIVLNYRSPITIPRYNPARKNLIITWDILLQDFRTISLDNCELERAIPANEEFWRYFNTTIYPMSRQQKIDFMMS